MNGSDQNPKSKFIQPWMKSWQFILLAFLMIVALFVFLTVQVTKYYLQTVSFSESSIPLSGCDLNNVIRQNGLYLLVDSEKYTNLPSSELKTGFLQVQYNSDWTLQTFYHLTDNRVWKRTFSGETEREPGWVLCSSDNNATALAGSPTALSGCDLNNVIRQNAFYLLIDSEEYTNLPSNDLKAGFLQVQYSNNWTLQTFYHLTDNRVWKRSFAGDAVQEPGWVLCSSDNNATALTGSPTALPGCDLNNVIRQNAFYLLIDSEEYTNLPSNELKAGFLQVQYSNNWTLQTFYHLTDNRVWKRSFAGETEREPGWILCGLDNSATALAGSPTALPGCDLNNVIRQNAFYLLIDSEEYINLPSNELKAGFLQVQYSNNWTLQTFYHLTDNRVWKRSFAGDEVREPGWVLCSVYSNNQ